MDCQNERPSLQTMALENQNWCKIYTNQKLNKILPRFAHKLSGKNLNLLFFTCDVEIINYFNKKCLLCLFCNKAPSIYNFNFCKGVDCWVLFSSDYYENYSILLGRFIQKANANKVRIVPFLITEDY